MPLLERKPFRNVDLPSTLVVLLPCLTECLITNLRLRSETPAEGVLRGKECAAMVLVNKGSEHTSLLGAEWEPPSGSAKEPALG